MLGESAITRGDDGDGLAQFLSAEPTAEFVAQFSEEYARLLECLGDDQLRSIAVLKMEGPHRRRDRRESRHHAPHGRAAYRDDPQDLDRRGGGGRRLMNPSTRTPDASLLITAWRRIDGVCLSLRGGLAGGRTARDAPLPGRISGPERFRLFQELLAIDKEFCSASGERWESGPIREAFPEYLDAIDSASATPGKGVESTRLRRDAASTAIRGPGEDSETDPGTGRPTLETRTDLDPDRRLALIQAGFEVLGELGRGGMGVVYLARQVSLNRHCALKTFLDGLAAEPEMGLRFLAEAEAVARLQHPNIVQVFQTGTAAGRPFLALEYLPGGSLDKTLDGTPRPASPSARLVETIARAIASAHGEGIVHRDLKPANILLTSTGVPKVADFGLAKFLKADSGLTQTQSILGSPCYMAPEQAEGKNREVGPAADVYALGAILYELLTGRPPFRAATVLQTLEQVKNAEPIPPSRMQPGLPKDVETICLKCLEKDPGRRYASAEALADDLKRFLDHRPILARRIGSVGRFRRWCVRNPVVAVLSGTVLACLIAIATVASLAAVREARTGEPIRRKLYFSQMNNTEQAWESANVGRMRALLEPYRHDAKRDDLRGFEWYYWWRLAHGERRSLIGHQNEVRALAFAPDGKALASAERGQQVDALGPRDRQAGACPFGAYERDPGPGLLARRQGPGLGRRRSHHPRLGSGHRGAHGHARHA